MAPAAEEPVQAASNGRWNWLLFVLSLPLCIVLLEHVVLPSMTRIVLQGRLSVRSISLWQGISDLTWHVRTKAPYDVVVRISRIYFSIHWPGISIRSIDTKHHRVQFITLHIDGTSCEVSRAQPSLREEPQVNLCPASRKQMDLSATRSAASPELSPSPSPSPSLTPPTSVTASQLSPSERNALHSDSQTHASLPRLCNSLSPASSSLPTRESSTRLPDVEPSSKRRVCKTPTPIQHTTGLFSQGIRRLVKKACILLQSLAAFMANFVAIDISHSSLHAEGTDIRAELDRLVVHAFVFFTDLKQPPTPDLTSAHDGFDDRPISTRKATPVKVLGLHIRVPEIRSRAYVDFLGARIMRQYQTVLDMPESAALTIQARLRESVVCESVSMRSHIESIWADVQPLHSALHDLHAWAHAVVAKAPTSAGETASPRPSAPAASGRHGLQRRAPSFLAYFGGASISLAHAHFRLSLPGTPHAEANTTLVGLHASLENSNPSDEAHQAWFGACGVRRRALDRERIRLCEARRIFFLNASLASIKTFLHAGPTKRPNANTMLASVSQLKCWVRTSVTPFGILPSLTHTNRHPLFFASDPNEAAVAIRLSVGQIRSAPDVAGLTRLADALRALPSQRAPPPHDTESTVQPPSQRPVSLPRIALLVQVETVDLIVHRGASRHAWDEDGGALVMSIPKVHITMQASYSERVSALRDVWRGFTTQNLNFETCPMQYTLDSMAGFAALSTYLTGSKHDSIAHCDILHVKAPELSYAMRVPTSVDALSWTPHVRFSEARTRLSLSIQQIDVHLWEEPVLSALTSVVSAVSSHVPVSRSIRSLPKQPPASKPFFQQLPSHRFMHVGIGRIAVYIGSSDMNFEPEVRRGVGLVLGPTVLDYARLESARSLEPEERISRNARQALRLPEHIGICAHTVALQEGTGAACKLVQHGLRVFPIVHMAAMRDPPVEPSEKQDAQAIYVQDQWDFESLNDFFCAARQEPRMHQLQHGTEILHIPELFADAQFRPTVPNMRLDVRLSHRVDLRIVLTNSYCVLMAAETVKRFVDAVRPAADGGADDAVARPTMSPDTHTASPRAEPTTSSLHIYVSIPRIGVHVALPHERRLFLLIENASVRVRAGIRVSFDSLRARVPPELKDSHLWDEGVIARRMFFSYGETPSSPKTIWVTGECLHVRIPYGYHTHKLVEASIVAFKATKQLFFQFVRGYTTSAIYPHNEAPKHLPRVSLRLGMFVLEAADHSFDAALSLIFRAGLDEQMMRMERERVFEQRASDVSPAQAAEMRERLHALQSSNWIRRWHNARHVRSQRERALYAYIHKRLYNPHEVHEGDSDMQVRTWPAEPPLCRLSMTMFSFELSQPTSFALDDTHTWLHQQAGNPVDLEYTTLIPMHARICMSECMIRMRDYPLPLLHIPPRDDMDICFDAEGDVVIAEQLGDEFSVRHVKTTIVPAVDSRHGAEHGLLVPKSAMSPKFYGPVTIHVSSQQPTIFTWGQSLQPAFHDFTRVIDAIISPPHDPSRKPGPWDKLPFQLQGQVQIFFENDVHLHLKGSRSPYQLTGAGSGWVMVWRRHIELRLGYENPDMEFLQVRSGEHLLAVPDLRPLLDPAALGLSSEQCDACPAAHSVLVRKDSMPSLRLDKISWQLCGGVRWGMGLVSERTCTNDTCERVPRCEGPPFYRQCRFFGRIPHWQVRLRSFEGYERLPPEQKRDSYLGWRSDFMHMSFSLQAIGSDGEHQNAADKSASRNCLYLTLRTWNHFRDWLHLFNGRLNLPVRQGKVFPKPPGVKSPKFGLFLATIKYRFLVTGLHLSHTYQQHSQYDLRHGLRTFVGIKAKLGTFYLDLHQRMQESIHRPPVPNANTRRSVRKPLYEAEVDVSKLDIFSLCARFCENHGYTNLPNTSIESQHDLLRDVFLDMDEEDTANQRMYDGLDFSEMGMFPCSDKEPLVHIRKIMTLARFNFHRLIEPSHHTARRPSTMRPPNPFESQLLGSPAPSTDPAPHASDASARSTAMAHQRMSVDEGLTRPQMSPDRSTRSLSFSLPPLSTYSKFGHEHTHTCLIRRSSSVMDEQLTLERQRLDHLTSDIIMLKSMLDLTKFHIAGQRASHLKQLACLQEAHERVKSNIAMLEQPANAHDPSDDGRADSSSQARTFHQLLDQEEPDSKYHAFHEEWDSFNNQVFVFNPVAVLISKTRDVLLQYYNNTQLHRSFLQRLSIVEQRQIHALLERARMYIDQQAPSGDMEDASTLLDDVIVDTTRLACANLPDTFLNDFGADSSSEYRPNDGISDEFLLRKKTICLCVQPEVIFHSRIGENSTLIFHADQMRLRNYALSDSMYDERSINHNVLHRNFISMRSLQVFHTERAIHFNPESYNTLESLQLPVEALNGQRVPGYQRLVRGTHAFVIYDKHNRLRLHDRTRSVVAADRLDDPSVNYLQHNMDLIQLMCPRFTLTATSEQYAAIYNVYADLLMHTDPLHEELERHRDSLAYSYSFDDPDYFVHVIASYQRQIHDLINLKQAFESDYALLNSEGHAEYVRICIRVMDLYVDLCMLEEAIFMSHASARDRTKHLALLLRACANSMEWNMISRDAAPKDSNGMLVRLSLQGNSFSCMSLVSGTSINCVTTKNLHARNAHPSAYFEDIISKYYPPAGHPMIDQDRFFLAHWLLLAPSGGIKIVDRSELHIHPVRVQLELRLGRQVMDYLFGSRRTQAKEEEEAVHKRTWLKQILSMSRKARNTLRSTSPTSESDSDTLDSESDNDSDDPGDNGSAITPISPSTMDDTGSFTFARQSRWDPDTDKFMATNAIRSEMLRRAEKNLSFVHVMIAAVAVCLSYKGDGEHSLTNLYDLDFQLPRLEYKNAIGSYRDLIDLLRKDMIRIAWDHRHTLLKGVISTNSRKHALLKRLRANRISKYGDAASVDLQNERLGDEELAAAVVASMTVAPGDLDEVVDPMDVLNSPSLPESYPSHAPHSTDPETATDTHLDANTPDTSSPSAPGRTSKWRHAFSSRLHHVADDAASFVSHHINEEQDHFKRLKRFLYRKKDT